MTYHSKEYLEKLTPKRLVTYKKSLKDYLRIIKHGKGYYAPEKVAKIKDYYFLVSKILCEKERAKS